MILWVVALRPEGEPWIAERGLVASPAATPWPLFVHPSGSEALVISGVGATLSAAACGWLYGHLGAPADAVWLNVGIAGHAEGPVGRALVAHRVIDSATGRAWYPPPLPGHGLPGDTLHTVSRPETEFAAGGAYDMEAAGFLAATARLATAEAVQVVKVISDTRDEPARIDKARVRALIAGQLATVAPLVAALGEVGRFLEERSATPPGWEELLAAQRFSVTQRRQLRRLLERHEALSGDASELAALAGSDAKGLLRRLTERVEHLGMRGPR